MDDEKINQHITTLGEQLIAVADQLAHLRAAVNVLKLCEAVRMSPDDPVEALKVLRQLEEKQISLDPQAQEAKQSAELLDALKKWKKSGGGQHSA